MNAKYPAHSRSCKDDGPGMVLHDFQYRNRPGFIRIGHPAKRHAEFGCGFNGPVLPGIPSRPHDVLIPGNIIRNPDVLMMGYCLPLEIHVDQNPVPKPD